MSKQYLSEVDFQRIRKLAAEGIPRESLASIFNISKVTLWRIINDKTVPRNKIGGPKRSTSKQDDDFIRRTLKKFHYMPIEAIQREHLPMFSMNIIRKRMKEFELQRRKAMIKPYLSRKLIRERLLFAKNYIEYRSSFWKSIFFCDEVLFLDKPTKSLQTVICGKNFPREHTTPTATFKNCRRMMVWMAIKFGERPVWRSTSDTINSKVFIAIVKDAFGYNGISRRRMDTVILQDNAPVHRSKEVRI